MTKRRFELGNDEIIEYNVFCGKARDHWKLDENLVNMLNELYEEKKTLELRLNWWMDVICDLKYKISKVEEVFEIEWER